MSSHATCSVPTSAPSTQPSFAVSSITSSVLVVGMRAGEIVQGFVRKGDNAANVRPIEARPGSTGLVTLGELAKRHGISLKDDILVMEKKVRYCTHLVKVDTKDFGLPQTRQRQVRVTLCDVIVASVTMLVSSQVFLLYGTVPVHLEIGRSRRQLGRLLSVNSGASPNSAIALHGCIFAA
jgi:hypothetical protein